ncbi:hypothetical protein CYLTODRAFT_425752 [Cylindrobasidium torrendii FP15055 ss-10]|uniref:Uncharacterized protein n=1 Tax=Cylindrobasidium torrendii FP15055 ss-10 TaxID=1314674 RepID=A0A0D7B071_9AGAR|nr:hypothetical protein CYLTODRAFT_425752 [Cylindrobasidium torrendii FP15055 ss-10]
MSTFSAACIAVGALLIYLTHRYLLNDARKELRLRGPPSPPSWLLGHSLRPFSNFQVLISPPR